MLKNKYKKILALCSSLLVIMFLSSCGASFNTVGISSGNLINGAEVTNQGDTLYYIEQGNIYKQDLSKKDTKLKGEKILEGDRTSINVVGEKIYFYDKSISTIVKANSGGFKHDRIAEIYTDNFVVQKDNVFANILIGSGSENLESADNFNVVRMKVTDRKLTSQVPQLVFEGGRLVAGYGDRIYIEKMKDNKRSLVSLSVKGDDEIKLIENFEGSIIVTGDSIFLMGEYKDKFGIHKFSHRGKQEDFFIEVGKSEKSFNSFNVDGKNIFYQDYKKDEDYNITDSILLYNMKDKSTKTVLSKDKDTKYYIALAKDRLLIKAKEIDDLDQLPSWEFVSYK